MSFLFSMQKILDYREQLEEEAKVKLAKAQALYLSEQERIAELEVQLETMQNDLYKRLDMEHGERWLLENFIKGIRTDMANAHLRMRQFHQLVDQCREIVLDRAKNRKILEKLKEKQQERFYIEERDKERKNNDETATLRHKAPTF